MLRYENAFCRCNTSAACKTIIQSNRDFAQCIAIAFLRKLMIIQDKQHTDLSYRRVSTILFNPKNFCSTQLLVNLHRFDAILEQKSDKSLRIPVRA